MPDTIRSEAELLAQFADNATGNISAQDLRDLVVSAKVDEAQSLALPLDASDPEQIVNIPEGGVSDWADIENKPTFATVATSGSYNDLSNKPTIPTLPIDASDVSGLDDALAAIPTIPQTWNILVGNNAGGVNDSLCSFPLDGSDSNVIGNLATVATSGSFIDLNDKPDFATYPIDAVNTTGFAPVAKSGDYYDLDNRPANLMGNGNLIQPTGYEGAVFYQQSNRLQMAPSFTTDGENVTAVAFIGSGDQLTGFADVARSGSFADLTDQPTVPNTPTAPTADGNWILHTDGGAVREWVPAVMLPIDALDTTGFATVATSGDYNDLINKPANLSDFLNDLGLAAVATTGSYNDLSDTPTIQTPVPLDDYQYISLGSSSLGLQWIKDTECQLNLANLQINGVDLATVATTGSFNDLSDVPDIATFPVDATDNSQIVNLATVATSGNYNDLDDTPTDPNPRIPDILTGSHDGTYVVQVASDVNSWQATSDVDLSTRSLTVSDGEDTSTLTPMLLTVNEAKLNLIADSLNSNGSDGQVLANSGGTIAWSDPINPYDQSLNMGDNATFNSITVGAAPASFGVSSVGEIVASSSIGSSGQVLASGGFGFAASWQNVSDLIGQSLSTADDVTFNSVTTEGLTIGGQAFLPYPATEGEYKLSVDASGIPTWVAI